MVTKKQATESVWMEEKANNTCTAVYYQDARERYKRAVASYHELWHHTTSCGIPPYPDLIPLGVKPAKPTLGMAKHKLPCDPSLEDSGHDLSRMNPAGCIISRRQGPLKKNIPRRPESERYGHSRQIVRRITGQLVIYPR